LARRKVKLGECTYCGNVTVVTRDHVVPRALFVPPYPSHLIVVPACRPCNEAKSRNEDYLRDFLTVAYRGSQSPITQTLLSQKVLRSFRRNSSELIRTAIPTTKFSPLYTHGGIYLGDYPTGPVSDARLFSILGLSFCKMRRGRAKSVVLG
jgi:hypothetical protein